MELTEARKQINEIDDKIIQLLSQRLDICNEIADYKKAHNLPILNKARENEILARITLTADNGQAPYIAQVFQEIMTVAKDYQIRKINL